MKFLDLIGTLETQGVTPSKSLGQNFLHDANIASWIVRQANLRPGDFTLEIGPGLGALTEWLVEASAEVWCVEKDGRLAEVVAKRFEGKARVFHEDAIHFDTRQLFAKGPVTLVGNLPYYVTSPILETFADPLLPVVRMVLTVQKEMADRLCAAPGGKEYGGISAVLQRDWHIRHVKKLPPTVFYPEPAVDSSVIVLERREPEMADRQTYRELVRAGFSQRRKQLKKLIGSRFADWEAAAEQAGIAVTARAEELNLAQWAALACVLAPAGHAQKPEEEWFDVVDERDVVVSKATRREVHERDLKHRAVHIFIFNRAGELYLQKRSRWKDKHPSKWDSSAAGHLDAGIGYEETANREVLEELGIQTPLRELAYIEACEETGWEFVRLYAGEDEGPFRSPASEVEGGLFLPLPILEEWLEARPQDFAPGFVRCYRTWQSARAA